MDIPDILRALDAQISQLQQARQLLSDSVPASVSPSEPGKRRGRPLGLAKPAGKRAMSEEGKARIAAAQKKRWAKSKKAAKVAAAPPPAAKKSAPPAKKSAVKKPAPAAAPTRTATKEGAAPAKKAPAKQTARPAKKSIAEAPRSVEHTGPEQSLEIPETAEVTAAEA